MFQNLADWLDHRTGYRKLMDAMLLEHIPGGAKWRYVWGSCLVFVFTIQLVTGVLLMLHYSPGDSTAWGSVYFIQYQMEFGWLIRGLHHFGSQTMVVLLALHMLQVVIAGAQLPPREFNWWLGLALMGVVLGLSLTGYLLPWDQKGYFATRVATNIAGNMPVLGPLIQRVVVGGPEYGNHTLTQFFTLHVGILPPLLIVLVIAHLAVFRRHGVTAPANARGEDYFYPAQAFRDMVACMGVFAVMLSLVLFGGHGNKIDTGVDRDELGVYQRWATAGIDGRGANLDAPADRDTEGYPARPEWYFLFLFQLLKYFEGELFLVGTVVIPNGALVLLALLPLFGYGRMRKFGHFLGIVVVFGLIAGVCVLTFLAMVDDSAEPILGVATTNEEGAKDFQKRLHKAEKEAQRAVQLAYAGIPETGARDLLRNDPFTRGPKIFNAKCASCHDYSTNELIHPKDKEKELAPKTASDLAGFGSYDWIRGLLTNPADPKYFGLAKGKIRGDDGKEEELALTGMSKWRKNIERDRKGYDKKEIEEEEKAFDAIARLIADQARPVEQRDKELDAKAPAGKLAREKFGDYCASCHSFEAPENKTAPNLTNYGSAEWLRLMIMSPGSPSRHGAKNLMPAFRPIDGPGAEVPLLEFKQAHPSTTVSELSDTDREVLIRWMTGDNRVVFGGQTIAGSVKKK